ncbi:conserved hypothetical protein [Staphylothermus marinus F1]|uniref:MrpA C-terminal/MbhD domain-containing protein n=1 Tax=Staphylothermus marinus (strain ATCC 43588 / DSM 3639 / JCM 9404 / F1) TaxID=399550 RepID=A3DNF5_STAMF|nr:hydrogenase subunit MbhD domain-containing protein [Staphylothermus marinus]ABN70165.1 conserved hypothetical protein [Staphylothermus marinus F1]
MIKEFTLAFLMLVSIASVIAAYLAIKERDMVRAIVYSAIQSAMYALIFYILMAPDIVLVYVPVSVGLTPAILLFVTKKTERYDGD